MRALPPLLFREEALRRWVGFNAQQVRQGSWQRGAAKRPGPRTAGPIGPETLAPPSVKLNLRALEALFNGSSEALAQVGVLARQVTGLLDATALEPTAHSTDGGQVPRQRKGTAKPGQPHAIEVTVYGW